jgi:UDP-4-amino-4,6-dideoxy-N-acetyl-beta-L-altrosamine transaminase
MIPYSRQSISKEDIETVVKVLKSDFLTQGKEVPAFEGSVCEYTGSKFAIAVNSATSGLHIACLALGLGNGDTLWTSPITFVASANCGLYCGAKVDFVDIDPLTWNISIEKLELKLKKAKIENSLPKILVVVHLCGLSCDMKSINILSKKYGFKVIEDASHAIGGRFEKNRVGNCVYSNATIFSFHAIKGITTGEGGMVLTNNQDLAIQVQLLRNHGISREKSLMTHTPDGPWYYQQIALGFNYRMTDIQGALGRSQLKRLDNFISRRHEIATIYDDLLAELPLKFQYNSTDSYSGMHLYVVRINSDKLTKTRKEIFEFLRMKNIGVNVHYIPVHLQPFYKQLGFTEGQYPEAESYYREAISLPVYPDLKKQDLNKVVKALRLALK